MTDSQEPKKPKKLQPRLLIPKKMKEKQQSKNDQTTGEQSTVQSGILQDPKLGDLKQSLSSNLDLIKQEIGHNSDVRFREFHLSKTGIQAAIVFIDGLSDMPFISENILKPLMLGFSQPKQETQQNNQLIDLIQNHFLAVSGIKPAHTFKELITKVFAGSTVLLVDGSSQALIIGAKAVKSRSMEEPSSEPLVRGPRISFNETLSDNTGILRLRVANPNLTMIHYELGKQSKKSAVIVYINGIANEELVAEVKRKIEQIDIDDVPESGYIEQLIEENYLSPFPQVQSTERPDRVIAGLLEGRVAILLDGTPFALVMPVTFAMFLQSPEDYYERWIPASLIRMLRYLAAFISVFLPSIYISFISFHQGLIPTKLAISIAGTREGVPFPSLIESLIMEVSIEILREAGLRLPKPVGQTVGLVGGLVIGEAAVQAGIISPIMVIVVALTAISSFAIPQYNAGISLRLLRFSAMFSAAFLGLYGVIMFFLVLAIHFVRLKSFGVPYSAPYAPYRLSDWKDYMVRMPIFMMLQRPKMLFTRNKVRQKRNE